MYAQVPVASELGKYGVRYRADSHLQAGSVLNKGGAMLTYSCFRFIRLAEMRRLKRCVAFHEDVYEIHRYHRLSPCPRHIGVHDCYYGLGAFDCRESRIYGGAERNEAVLVRRADLNHCHVAPQCSASVEFLRLAEEYRNIVGISALDSLAYIRSYEKALMKENPVKLRVGIWCGAFCVKVVDADILKFTSFPSFAESVNKQPWCACDTAQMHMVS